MRNVLPIIIFACTLFYSSAYTQPLDSLNKVVQTHHDSTQVNALIEIGKILRRKNLDSAIATLDKAYRRGVVIGYTKGQISALSSAGIGYGMNDQYANAIQHFEQVIDLSQKHGYPEQEYHANNHLGIVYKRMGDYTKSLTHYNTALGLAKQNGIPYASTYSNLAILYDLMKDYDRALDIYNKVLVAGDSVGDLDLYNSTLANVALTYLNLEKLDTAIYLLNKTLKNRSTTKDYSYFNNISNLGYAHYRNQNYDSSLYYSSMVIDSANIPSTRHLIPTSYYNRALALHAKGQYQEALIAAEKALGHGDELGYYYKVQAFEVLSQIHQSMGMHATALEYFKRYKQYNDSIYDQEKLARYKAEEIKQEVFDKNQEIVLQQQELRTLELQSDRDKYWLSFMIAFILLLIISLVLLYQRFRYKERINKLLSTKNDQISKQKAQIEIINEQLESRMLRAQINPHFIFNALSSIQHFITSDDKKKALRYLNKFSGLLRQVLENSINVKVPIQDELKFLEYYLELESLRFDGAFAYQINVEPDVDLHGQEIPVLLLQPFAENAILHGLLPKHGAKELIVNIKDNGSHILYEIRDNGIGREEASKIKSGRTTQAGRGMSVTAQRIEMLTTANQQANVRVTDLVNSDGQAAGTEVSILIPKLI